MRRKIFKFVVTMAAAATLFGGVGAVGHGFYDLTGSHVIAMAAETSQEDGEIAESAETSQEDSMAALANFDSETESTAYRDGYTIYLRGHVKKDDVRALVNERNVFYIVAQEGTVLPEDCSSLFWYFNGVQSIDLTQADSSNVTNMEHMFYFCSKLAEVKLTGFDTSHVTNMKGMFSDCSKIWTLDLSMFNTSNVTTMQDMFYECRSLHTLNVSSFCTSKVTNFSGMFGNCIQLPELNVSHFDTSSATNLRGMFYGCKYLEAINVSGFKTSNVITMEGMFNGCQSVTSLNVAGFDTSNVVKMRSMFQDCKKLTSLDLSHFNTSNVTDMCMAFWGCEALPSLDISNFDVTNTDNLMHMFDGCKNLQNLNVNGLDVKNITWMPYMFSDCSSLTSLDLSSFDTSKLDYTENMFAGCTNLKTIYVSDQWNMDLVDRSRNMFRGCGQLVGGNGTVFDENVTDVTYAQIDEGETKGYLTRKNVNKSNGVVRSASAAFKDMIELNFYCEMPAEILADENAYVLMYKEGAAPVKKLVKSAKTAKVKDQDGEHETKRFSYSVVAKELREKVVFHLYDGKGNEIALKSGSGNDYGKNGCALSVVDYCDMVLEKSTDEVMITLAKAVKDYGTAAQIDLNYKAGDLAVSSAVTSLNPQPLIDGYAPVKTGSAPNGLKSMSLSVALEESNALRVYYVFKDGYGPGRYSYAIDDAKKSIVKAGGKNYLTLTGIAAKDMDQPHRFAIMNSTKSYVVEISALSYARALCLLGDSAPDKVNLGKAMYLYNQAAKAYFSK